MAGGRAQPFQLSGLMIFLNVSPRVARSSQPWAKGRNPVGIGRDLERRSKMFLPKIFLPCLAPAVSDFGLRPSFGLPPSAFPAPLRNSACSAGKVFAFFAFGLRISDFRLS